MPTKLLISAIALLGLTAWRDAAPEWPVAGPMPDEPGHATRSTYEAVNAGTRSYRPVDPMPWGDVNRRVAPPGGSPSDSPGATPSTPPVQETPAQPEQHQHH